MKGQDKIMQFSPETGEGKPYPSHAQQWRDYHGNMAFLYNPWVGNKRHALDVGSDPFGFGIVAEEPPKETNP